MANLIAVKDLAYFVCQSGDLTMEFFSNRDYKAGKDAHLYLQKKYNQESKSEYYIKKDLNYLGKTYTIHGFIDGVIKENDEIIIEEIKSTLLDLDTLSTQYHKEHLAQLKIYSYLYMLENQMDKIKSRLTYISIVDYNTRSFSFDFSLDELENFFFTTLESYLIWEKMIEDKDLKLKQSIKDIKFPYATKRPGQNAFMKKTYETFTSNGILYVIAPTGIGKTIAAIFAGLKSLKPNDKLFYLTAQGSGKNAPLDALKLLHEKGLRMKAIDITAKRKMCNAKRKNCNPEECIFAHGYFDRLKDATYEIFSNYDIFDYAAITKVSNEHQICGFEFSLYLSYFCDFIIADYNYVFDPVAHLIRYFEDDTYHPKVLVDEAHNLISRSKEMYSAYLNEKNIRDLRKLLTGYKPSARKYCNKIIELLENYRDYLKEKTLYVDTNNNLELDENCRKLISTIEQINENNTKIEHKDEIMEVYFLLRGIVRMSEVFGENHRLVVKISDDMVNFQYLCLDASRFLSETIHNAIYGITFFSATLYPIDYHKTLLSENEGDSLILPSPFDPNNLDIIINNNISTKYRDRVQSIDSILETIDIVYETKKGNYIVFFPSYQYLKMVSDKLELEDVEVIIQNNTMTDFEKKTIIDKFRNEKKSHLGLFVMGGAFSEGIDYIGDSLNGVIIIGVGLPLYCDENNILKDYYQEKYQLGFDYAYTYPGITKVIQAVGRVIRTETDRGIAILMDERFNNSKYYNLMPKHWKNIKIINYGYELKRELDKFYKDK